MSYHKFDDLDCGYWPISTETVQRKAAVSIAATAKTRAVRGVDMDKKWRHLKKPIFRPNVPGRRISLDAPYSGSLTARSCFLV